MISEVTARDGGDVVVVVTPDGKAHELPWQVADELAKALRAQARRVEEREHAERLALDAAIVFRAGAPFGLTSHPKIQAEAVKLALGDRSLRRYMPGGVRSRVMLGAPSVIVSPATTEKP